MNRIIALLLVCTFVFAGCSIETERKPLDMLRSSIAQGNGCEFDASIIAEYDSDLRRFELHCKVDEAGKFTFSVKAPETIKGVSGSVDEDGGELTYDGIILTFPLMADGVLSPVCGPWLLYRCVQTGLVRFVSKDYEGNTYTFDETFRGEAFCISLIISVEGIPLRSEIYWNDMCIIKIRIDNFVVL